MFFTRDIGFSSLVDEARRHGDVQQELTQVGESGNNKYYSQHKETSKSTCVAIRQFNKPHEP